MMKVFLARVVAVIVLAIRLQPLSKRDWPLPSAG